MIEKDKTNLYRQCPHYLGLGVNSLVLLTGEAGSSGELLWLIFHLDSINFS
jgi:hypothetical protein